VTKSGSIGKLTCIIPHNIIIIIYINYPIDNNWYMTHCYKLITTIVFAYYKYYKTLNRIYNILLTSVGIAPPKLSPHLGFTHNCRWQHRYLNDKYTYIYYIVR